MLGAVKIAVCVKEVPEASSARRLDPSTFRLDRSGEGALNEFDAHALEEALKVKDADAGDRGRRALDGAREGGRVDAQGARDGRRPGRARHGRRRRRIRSARHIGGLGRRDPEGSPGPRAPRPAGRRLRRRRPLGRARRPAPAAARVAGGDARARRRHGEVEAPDRVRLRRPRGAAPRAGRGLGRDQPAALPVAQGDHGREEEADRHGHAGRSRRRRRRRRAGRVADGSLSASPPPSRGDTQRIEDDGGSSAEQIVAFLAERKLV